MKILQMGLETRKKKAEAECSETAASLHAYTRIEQGFQAYI